MTQELKQELKQHLEERFLFEFDDEITEDSDLFKAGVIDSFGYIELIAHIEHQYGVKLSDEDLLDNVMVSLPRIVDFVDTQRAHGAGSE